MLRRTAASRYLAVSLTTLALCVATQTGVVLAQDTQGIATSAKRPTTVSLSGLFVENSSLTEEQLHTIVTDGLLGHTEALLGWSADTLSIPEVVVTIPGSTKKAKPTVISYRDVNLTNVKDGTAERLSIGSITTTNKVGETLFELIGFDNVSFANIARVLDPNQSQDREFYSLFTGGNLESGTFFSEEVMCNIGKVTTTEYQMRLSGSSIAALIQLTNGKTLDTVDGLAILAPFLSNYGELINSVKSGPSDIASISCASVRGDPTDLTAPADIFSAEAIRIAGIEPGLYPEISASNIVAKWAEDYSLTFEDLTFKTLDFTRLADVVRDAPTPVTETWINENQRLLTPDFTGLAFNGMKLDVMEDEPFAITVDAFDLTLADYINGIPSRADVSANSIVVDLPSEGGEDIFIMMRDAGLTQIDGSFRVAGKWTEVSETIEIEDVSFDIKDMASVEMAGQLTKATRLLFALDDKEAMAATRALALKALTLDITDNGIGDVVLAAVSGELGADAKAMRPVYADLVKGTIIAYLADLAEAANLGDAIGKFVGGTAKTLHLGVTSKSEDGIPLDTFEAAEDDPSAILSQINVSAKAE